jgi:putative heme-binding domain-containing protein
VKLLALVLVFAVGLAFAQGEPQNPYKNDPGAVEVGRGIFRISCSPCHGIHAEGGRGPNLTLGVYSVGDRDVDLFNVIMNGVQYSEMRGYAGMGPENVWRIVSYLRVAAKGAAAEKLPGDAASGEKLFWGKGACGQCHRVNTRGGRLGPDLTRSGRSRTPQYLRESVVSPNADITPGYDTIIVLTRDGKTIQGTQRGFDNFSAQLVDIQGNYYSFLKSEVSSIQRDETSQMPGGYQRVFSKAELDDLVAYLSSLGVKR